MTCLLKFFADISTNWKIWTVVICLFFYASLDNAYCFDTASFKQYPDLNTLVPSKLDLTKLPHGTTFQVNHSQFTLQFFFNNRDIFGYIFKREPNSGIAVHLCFFRSCDESPYDFNQLIARPQVPPYDKAYFSVMFPRGLQYEFQGLEFLPFK